MAGTFEIIKNIDCESIFALISYAYYVCVCVCFVFERPLFADQPNVFFLSGCHNSRPLSTSQIKTLL